jgi:flagellar assembly protein FliH
MRNYSRFIPGEEISAVKQWDFDAVDTASLLLAAQVKVREAATEQVNVEAVREDAYAEGFTQGRAQATLEAQRQMADYVSSQGKQAAQNFSSLFLSAQAQLADAEQVMARGILELACELARQVLRHELSVNPNVLQPVVRESLGLLIADSKSALIRLNPLDLDVLEDVLRAEFTGLTLTLLADASVQRGGCLVESAGAVVDGTLEKRWLRAIANLGLDSPWKGDVDET